MSTFVIVIPTKLKQRKYVRTNTSVRRSVVTTLPLNNLMALIRVKHNVVVVDLLVGFSVGFIR